MKAERFQTSRGILMKAGVDNLVPDLSCSSLTVTAQRGGVEIIDELAGEWRKLCDVAANDQPFYRPEFIRAHIRTMIPGAKVVLVTARMSGDLRLVLPLVEEFGSFSKMPVRRLRAPVNHNCGRFDAVRSSGPDGDAAIRATWQFLKQFRGWDLLQLRDTPNESTVSQIAEAARADDYLTVQMADNPNPYIPIPSDPELLKRMPPNSKLRSQLRQARLRLSEQGNLKFSRVDTADRTALDRFYKLEASGWKGRKGTDILHDGSKEFFDELAESAARFGYFSLYMLEFKGQLIAAHFALTYKRRCYSPKVAYDENFRKFAPGHLIIGEILCDCAVRGIEGYDITGQDQAWKMKWTEEVRPVRHYYIFNGVLGTMAHAVGSKLKPVVSRLCGFRNTVAVNSAEVSLSKVGPTRTS